MTDDPRMLVRRYFDALNCRDFDALDEMVAADLVHHSIPVSSRDELKRMLMVYYEGIPDLFHVIEDVIAEGDRIAVRTTTRGTHLGSFLGHAASHRWFEAAALTVCRLNEGVIQEVWEVFDTISMLQQIGVYAATPVSSRESSQRLPHRRRPPGPSAEVSFEQIRSDPLTFLKRLTSEYGDYVRYVCDGRETILLNHPAAIRHVLHDRATNYTKLDTPDLLLLKPMLGDGLLTTVGPIWKQDRQLLQPVFARVTAAAGDLMVDVIEEMLVRWRARPDPDAPLDIAKEMSRLTLEIAARVLLSTDFAAQSEAFGKAMSVLNESMSHGRPGDPVGEREFRPALRYIRQAVWQTVLARKFFETGEDDVLAALLQSQRERNDSDRQVIDQAVTILLAGHETTAKALTWAFALLDRNPEERAGLLAELEDCLGDRRPTADDLPHLPYTRAVIDEALRLDPPIWLLTRSAVADDEIGGYSIPAGLLVAISPYLIHRHPGLWQDPERFVPNRFLTEQGATKEYRYLPFGHGPRHCVGKWFAMLEMPLVLATVLRKFALTSLVDHIPEPEALVTLRPRDGLPMIVRARAPHPTLIRGASDAAQTGLA